MGGAARETHMQYYYSSSIPRFFGIAFVFHSILSLLVFLLFVVSIVRLLMPVTTSSEDWRKKGDCLFGQSRAEILTEVHHMREKVNEIIPSETRWRFASFSSCCAIVDLCGL